MVRKLQTKKYGKTRTNKKNNRHSLKRKSKKTKSRLTRKQKRIIKKRKKHTQRWRGQFSGGLGRRGRGTAHRVAPDTDTYCKAQEREFGIPINECLEKLQADQEQEQ